MTSKPASRGFLPSALLSYLTIVVLMTSTCESSKRTCFCEINQGNSAFSPRLLHVDDLVLKAPLVTCKKAGFWCPLACFKAARKRLLNGGIGGVAPLTGAAGETACSAYKASSHTNDTIQLHIYATYRVSNCGITGYHYLGRLCCWEYSIGDGFIYKFNENCSCGPKPPCDATTTENAGETTMMSTTDLSTTDVSTNAPFR